ncbi:aquaporin-12-like protein, partial [Dinothrombium tinctorium]
CDMMLAVFESIVPYLLILTNCILFKVARNILFPLTPRKFRIFVSEFISTLELCATISELGVVWQKHGDIGCSTCILLCCLWWWKVFGDAEAGPFGIVDECILLKRPITSFDIVLRSTALILAATLTALYTQAFWCLHLTSEHIALHTLKCEAALQVSVVQGFAIEFLISFISRIVALESFRFPDKIAMWVNAIATTILCRAALHTTGGFFNPILASALTLNCKGNNLFEHFTVYWVGALLGGLLARYIHIKLQQISRKKIE